MAERQLCGCLHHSFSEASPRPFNRSPTGMPTREYTGGISYRTCFPSNPSSSPRESTFVHTIAPVLEDFHRGEFGGVHEILRFLLIWSFQMDVIRCYDELRRSWLFRLYVVAIFGIYRFTSLANQFGQFGYLWFKSVFIVHETHKSHGYSLKCKFWYELNTSDSGWLCKI